jgi:hypothetical protein
MFQRKEEGAGREAGREGGRVKRCLEHPEHFLYVLNVPKPEL